MATYILRLKQTYQLPPALKTLFRIVQGDYVFMVFRAPRPYSVPPIQNLRFRAEPRGLDVQTPMTSTHSIIGKYRFAIKTLMSLWERPFMHCLNADEIDLFLSERKVKNKHKSMVHRQGIIKTETYMLSNNLFQIPGMLAHSTAHHPWPCAYWEPTLLHSRHFSQQWLSINSSLLSSNHDPPLPTEAKCQFYSNQHITHRENYRCMRDTETKTPASRSNSMLQIYVSNPHRISIFLFPPPASTPFANRSLFPWS